MDIGQALLGSYTFGPEDKYPILHALNDPADPAAQLGNGFFPDLNLGPETLWVDQGAAPPVLGNGALTSESSPLLVRFNGAGEPVAMPLVEVSKYVLRPAGLTGVFNTRYENSEGDAMYIYGYPFNFTRFAFRQDRNTLDDVTIYWTCPAEGLAAFPIRMQAGERVVFNTSFNMEQDGANRFFYDIMLDETEDLNIK